MIVIIDNYDSFTYNIAQYFKQIDENVEVVKNDAVTVADVKQLDPDLIVLSPGPGLPEESGICRDVLHHFLQTTPVLGICLGHQMIVEYFGGTVEKGVRPMQGKVSQVIHDGDTIFRNIPSPVTVTRYHSLQTPVRSMPPCLTVSSFSDDGVVMSVRHESLPIEGIQFHPESIRTEFGFEMLQNFYNRARAHFPTKEGIVG